ncbi:hypothetical protein EYF80_013936 [Liparis tanakae]|uniref:Uncharacterized protein n=1 Tax=Liparis tanakae TaxID=230148 RepID=A0A4Z2ICJ2_9TELE|nr:hypothetical protein EYF80_013936 [Liparis tanakae]
MEEKIQTLQSQNQAWQQKHELESEQIHHLSAQNKMVEDVCLRIKRKNQGFLGRKTQDRDTVLDKMKNKMFAKKNKKKGKQEKETVSVIPTRCTQACELERKSWETLTVETRVHWSQLEENILSLTETLEAQKQLLRQSNQSWQDKYDAVEEKSALEANGFETRIQNLLLDCNAVEEMCQERIDTAERLELENQVLVQKQQSQELEIQQLTYDSKILEEICLQFKKNNPFFFWKKMQDRDTELDKMKNKMEVKQNKKKGKQEEETVSLIPARCTKACNLERKSWETLTVEHRVHLSQLEENILSLTETLEAQKQLLRQSNQSWQDKYYAVEEKSALAANGFETRIQDLLSECKAVEETCQEQIDTAERLELENQVLVQKQQSQESEIQQLTYDSKILEEICLQFKKKNPFFFWKKMQDRDTELDKMKNKMEVKQNLKKGSK